MSRCWDENRLLEAMACLPMWRAFTAAEAYARGVLPEALSALVGHGLLRHPIRGVYVAPQLDDNLSLRIQMLRLVVPSDCIVTDQTAAWLWGAEAALPPGSHLVTPLVSVFAPPGRRLRNGLVDSGERMLAPGDVQEVEGLLVTTPLRTACDVARLLLLPRHGLARDQVRGGVRRRGVPR